MEYHNRINDLMAVSRSLIEWWTLAGVDCAVEETPRRWVVGRSQAVADASSAMGTEALEVPAQKAISGPPAADFAPPGAAATDLTQCLPWLASDPARPERTYGDAAILPNLAPGPRVVLINDMPTAGDMVAGALFAGDDGRLAAQMLRAINVTPEDCGHASLLLARPPGGVGDDAAWRYAAARMRHLLALARPEMLLLFGDRTNRALCQPDSARVDKSLPFVNLDEPNMRVAAVPAAFILLGHADRKAEAWKTLRALGGRR